VKRLARTTFASLSSRNFRLFFFGQGISQVGNWLTLVAQALLVLKLTNNGVYLGGLAAAQFGPVLLIGPWAGLVADRSDKRRLLLIVQVIAMAQSFALAALAFTDKPSVLAVYAIALVGGITVAFDNPARRSFVVEMVPVPDVNNAVSLNSALMTASRVIGPAVAGLLISTVGFGWCFLLDAVSYIAVVVGLWMMRTEELRRPPVTPKAKGQVREGLRYARSVHELWVPLAMMAVVGTLSYNFQTVFPLFATRDLHGTAATYTLLFSVVSMGALAGALAAAHRRVITVRTVSVSALAYGAAMGVMALVPNAATAYPVGVVLGLASIAFLTSSTAIVQIEAAPEMRGRVLALQAMLFLGSTPIGGPILGFVAEQFGARSAIGVGAVAAGAAGAWGLLASRRALQRAQLTTGADATLTVSVPRSNERDHAPGPAGARAPAGAPSA
jgi:MFS family permease